MSAGTDHRTRRAVVLAVTIGMIAALVSLVLLLRQPPAAEMSARPDPAPTVEEPLLPLTGLPGEADRPALLVKVSNSPEARPHTGIEAADIVFEEVTEGGVTRFIAVFHGRLPEVVGPVRSARPVDLQVLAGFGRPVFAYSGARAEVREMLTRVPAVTVTEGGPGFFRDGGAYASHPVAPHNLFLRPAETVAHGPGAGALALGDVGWAFDAEPPEAGRDHQRTGERIDVVMSRTSTSTWTYDASADVYRRAQDGQAMEVTGSGTVGAANVVVLDVRHYLGASGYPETDVIGQGSAVVLRNGHRYAARWSKPEAVEPLRILTPDGDAFPLAPGGTWLHLADDLPA